ETFIAVTLWPSHFICAERQLELFRARRTQRHRDERLAEQPLAQLEQRRVAAADRDLGSHAGKEGERTARGPLPFAALPHSEQLRRRQSGGEHHTVSPSNSVSASMVSDGSRFQPSFSTLMCSMATALALASRSGRAWYSETQAR